MPVSRLRIIARGLLSRCPNCGGNTVFRGLFRTNKQCTRCGLLIEREEGFFIGAMAINYGIAVLPLIPIVVLVALERISVTTALVVFMTWAIAFPIVFYRWSKSLWLALYYIVFPRELPANRRTVAS